MAKKANPEKAEKTMKTTKTTKKAPAQQEKAAADAKVRKPYPTHEERIVMADKAIARVTALIASREALVAETEQKLSERKEALERARNELAALQQKKAHIVANQNKPVVSRPRLTPEERLERQKAALAKARAVRKAAKEKRDALIEKLAQSGKSIDEVLAALEK